MAAPSLTRSVDERWERRLYNWALWRVGAAGSSVEAPAYRELDAQTIRDAWRTYTPPTPEPPALIGEALDTDDLVCQLADELRIAIMAQYCWTGTVAERASRAGCHAATLYRRVIHAKIALDAMDCARRRAMPRPPLAATG